MKTPRDPTLPVPPKPGAAGPAHGPGHTVDLKAIAASAEDADQFIAPALDAFRLIGRSTLVLAAGCLALDAAGLAAEGEAGLPGPVPLACAGAGAALVAAAAGLLASIQVRYTFEHAHTRKRHFYALKLARFREATAALRSLAVKDAVPAVQALGDLRRETGVLDRRLIVESLILRRRWRDLTWLPIALLAAATAAVLARLSPATPAALERPAACLAFALLAFAAVHLWARERVRRVLEVLSPAPPELARAFDQTPAVAATVERLLTRLNHHFDRLKGPRAEGFETEEEVLA